MPSSNSLLDNRSFNKLAVNRLEAQAIRSDNIQPASESISYLFSVLLENGTFERNNTGGTLTFDLNNENNDVIEFSDRPFRQTDKISMISFVDLFTLGGSNSFEEDPPNIVVAHSEEQRTYIMKLSSQNNNQVVFTLELLPGETHDLTTVTGRMSLFVDDGDDDENKYFEFTWNKDRNKNIIIYGKRYTSSINFNIKKIIGNITGGNFGDSYIGTSITMNDLTQNNLIGSWTNNFINSFFPVLEWIYNREFLK